MELRLRGSEAEYTTWKMEPHKPGKLFWVPRITGKIKLTSKKIKISAPYRTEPAIIDLSRMMPAYRKGAQYGGGAVTIAIKPRINIDINILYGRNKIVIENTDRKLIVEHAIRLFQKLINADFSVKVHVDENLRLQHMGVGSTGTLFTSLIFGLNELFNRPFSLTDLAKFVSLHYSEESNKKTLLPALTTGGSFWNAIRGGINVVGGDFQPVFSSKLPADWSGLLILAKFTQTSTSYDEQPELKIMDIVRHCDRFDAGKIAYWVLMDLVPAIVHQDLAKCGEIFWNLHLNTIRDYPPMISTGLYNLFTSMLELRYKYEFSIVYLSSAGPSIIVIDKKDKIAKMLPVLKKDLRNDYKIINIVLDNQGIVTKKY